MAEINLLDSQAHSSVIQAQGKLWLLRVVTGVFVLVILSYLALLVYGFITDKNISTAESKVSEYQAQFNNNKQKEEVLTRQGQLKNINQLLAAHKYWSPLLPELARVTLTSAKYTSISTDAKGGLELTVSTPSYAEAEKFLQVFDLPEYNKQFSNVRLLALTKSQEANLLQTTMRLRLTLNPEFFKK